MKENRTVGKKGVASEGLFATEIRVSIRPGKPDKMREHLENLEISWNFEKINKYHGKMI